MTTYRMADGDEIYEGVTWVDTIAAFDDLGLDEPPELVRERWVLVEAETITVGPTTEGDSE